jgi:mannose-6-phosphate isomerase
MDLCKQVGSSKVDYHYHLNKTTNMVKCPYFTTNLIPLTSALKKDYSLYDTFFLYLCTQGSGMINCLESTNTTKSRRNNDDSSNK